MENAISEKGLLSPSIERLTRLKSVASAKKKPKMKNISDPTAFYFSTFQLCQCSPWSFWWIYYDGWNANINSDNNIFGAIDWARHRVSGAFVED